MAKQRTVKQEVARLLQFKNRDRIAAFLESQGVKGELLDLHSCPVAKYLMQFVPTAEDTTGRVYVTQFLIETIVWPNNPYDSMILDENWSIAQTPLSEFIMAFDDGRYPSLEA